MQTHFTNHTTAYLPLSRQDNGEMEINGVKCNRSRNSPSPDLFTGMFTTPSITTSWTADDDLDEAEIFWNAAEYSPSNGRRGCFQQPKSSGVLAALNDCDNRRRILFQRNHSFVDGEYTPTSTASIRAPLVDSKPNSQRKEERKFSHSLSLPNRRLQNSAPVNIPTFSKALLRKNDEENDQILPPHEIVAVKVKTTSSVLEGAGRTLKGRDLRQVRNTVWQQTGFID